MPWSADEAKENLFRAVLALQETHGEKTTIGFLRDELTRLTVCREIKRNNAEIARLNGRLAELGSCLDTAIDALGFYADEDNYADRPGKPSAIRKDKGAAAREALEAVTAPTEIESQEDTD